MTLPFNKILIFLIVQQLQQPHLLQLLQQLQLQQQQLFAPIQATFAQFLWPGADAEFAFGSFNVVEHVMIWDTTHVSVYT